MEKVILPLGSKDLKYEKWSHRWERPYLIYKVLGNRAYQLLDIDSQRHLNPSIVVS